MNVVRTLDSAAEPILVSASLPGLSALLIDAHYTDPVVSMSACDYCAKFVFALR